MVNRYNYTSDIIKEYQNEWWKREFKVGNIAMFFTFIIAIVLLIKRINDGNVNIYSIFLVLMPIIYYIAYPIKKNKAIKAEIKKHKQLFENKNNIIEIKLDDKIIVKSNENKTEVEYTKVKRFVETKKLIIIFLKGDMTISLKKDSFIDSTSEECKTFLKEKIKSKKRSKRNKNV